MSRKTQSANLYFPVIPQPLRRADVADNGFPKSLGSASHCLIGRRIAVKDHDFRLGRQHRVEEIAERERAHTLVLETRHPRARPKLQSSRLRHHIADIRLFMAVGGLNLVDMLHKIVV